MQQQCQSPNSQQAKPQSSSVSSDLPLALHFIDQCILLGLALPLTLAILFWLLSVHSNNPPQKKEVGDMDCAETDRTNQETHLNTFYSFICKLKFWYLIHFRISPS